MVDDPIGSLGWMGWAGEPEEKLASVEKIVAPKRGGKRRCEQRMLFDFLQCDLTTQPEGLEHHAYGDSRKNGGGKRAHAS